MIKSQFLQLLNRVKKSGATFLSLKQTYNVGSVLIHKRGLHQTDGRCGKRKDLKETRDADSDLKEAAVKAAKSLPGDWTKTADALLGRLNIYQTPQEGVLAADKDPVGKDSLPHKTQDASETPPGESSLLKTMHVGRDFNRSADEKRQIYIDRRWSDKPSYESDTRRGEMRRKDSRIDPRPADSQEGLFARKRLGIFNAQVAKSAESCPAPVLGTGLWEYEDGEKLKYALGGLPKNGFEEQIEMTRQGQLWTFPVDNEADMHEERQYRFSDHIFLDKHLSQFPRKGPIRQFMELVCVGLGKNPYWTVPEKIEHIHWFADYFKGKQSIIERSLDENQRM